MSNESSYDADAMQEVYLDDGDAVPVVVVSRYRLAHRVALCYGCETFLVVDEEQSSKFDKFCILVRSTDLSFAVTWKITNPRLFHRGLSSLHELLEQNYPRGLTLEAAMFSLEFDGIGPIDGPSDLEQADG